MGLSESVIKSLTGPCEKSVHDCQKYTMDDMEIDSQCSECCQLHLKTHPHKDDEFESVSSEENMEHLNESRPRHEKAPA